MLQKRPGKEQLVDGLLQSLHYGKPKEDQVVIGHLCAIFDVPPAANLRDYLIQEVDFSYLFARLLQLVEPFTQMLSDIYTFLAKYKLSASTASTEKTTDTELRELLISENMSPLFSFDLEAFPVVEQEVLQQLPRSKPIYDKRRSLNHNISPLFLTDQLRDFGRNPNEKRSRNVSCPMCVKHFKERFHYIFNQLEILIESLSDEDISPDLKEMVQEYSRIFFEAKRRFEKGLHTIEQCRGYDHWQQVYHEFLLSFEEISTEETWLEQVQGLLKLFQLPFWEKRSQLYEVWTLIHFLDCLKDFSMKLNIQNGKWHLLYAKAKEPVAWITGEHFQLEVWFQKFQPGRVYTKKHVMPEILFMGSERSDGAQIKPLVLIECKEREGKSEDDLYKLASHYHEQIRAERYIYCNYLQYVPRLGLKKYRGRKEIICDGFRPGESIVPAVDNDFLCFLNKRVKLWALPL